MSRPPPSRSTTKRVTGPAYTTSATLPLAEPSPSPRSPPGAATVKLLRTDAEGAPPSGHAFGLVVAEQVGGADEAGDEGVGGLLVDLAGGADLLDAALVEDRDPVAQGERLLLVVA